MVYVAKNSHANYPKVVNVTADFDRTANGGPLWKCWEHVRYLGTEDAPTEAMQMLMANIRWGSTIENSSHTHGNSPTSPLDSNWFRRSGIDRSPIKTFDRKGKRINSPISVAIQPIPETQTPRNSDFFSLLPPKRLKQLEWHVDHPQKNQIRFDLWRRSKTLGVKKNYKKVISDLFDGAQTTIPDQTDGLYIKNVRLQDGAQATEPDFMLSIKGVEL